MLMAVSISDSNHTFYTCPFKNLIFHLKLSRAPSPAALRCHLPGLRDRVRGCDGRAASGTCWEGAEGRPAGWRLAWAGCPQRPLWELQPLGWGQTRAESSCQWGEQGVWPQLVPTGTPIASPKGGSVPHSVRPRVLSAGPVMGGPPGPHSTTSSLCLASSWGLAKGPTGQA